LWQQIFFVTKVNKKNSKEWECTPGHQQQDGRAFLDMFASRHFFYQSKEISGHLSQHTHSYELRKPVMNINLLRNEKDLTVTN
jgi:hypothetical protein